MKILLISGHGAGDPGATGNGYKEADLNIEVANNIKTELSKYADVTLYNTAKNAYADLSKGYFDVNIKEYDYVLEIHFNAFNGSAYGSEIFVTSSEKGITVEQNIMSKMSNYFKLRDNDSVFDGVKVTNFSVITYCKNMGVSSALLEVCFIDNANDIKIYQNNKVAIASDIATAIAEGFGLKEGTSTSSAPVTPVKTVTEIAKEVWTGKYGNEPERITNIENLGYNYKEVKAEVNRLYAINTSNKKSNYEIALEVKKGLWGNQPFRSQKITAAGYNYDEISKIVNSFY